MGEETPDTMNLDLNLSPGPEAGSGSLSSEAMNLDDWIDEPFNRIRQALRLRVRQRWRRRQFHIPPETQNLSVELNQLMGSAGSASTLQAGEGSVAADERPIEVPKTCENNNGFSDDELLGKKDDVEKGGSNDGSFFDCNICLDLARDPVVTCCGHLFCWPCLYRWLHVHSDAKECPVCKGEVTIKNVTPIYGRGSTTRELDDDPSFEIPLRPHARRVESLRQTIQRTPFSFPVEEMIRRLGSRFDLTRDITLPRVPYSGRERTNSLLNRILTSQGTRGEQNPVGTSDDINLTHGDAAGPETVEARRIDSLLLRRQLQAHRAASFSSIQSFNNVESYLRNHPIISNQEQPPPVDDRDSFSSIAAVINSESQMDNAAEIDSIVSRSTSSSRRRNEALRVSDVDSGDSRAPRRRRLN